ncbi:MAG: hypothetical protein HQL54_04900 [Magnetococcales bacterium]|nr:hypothetical protein [Magnetococcales bacterium]
MLPVWAILLILVGCTTLPGRIDNACSMLSENESWYASTKRTEKKWGVPIHVQLAIIHQESKFRHDARPPRMHLLGFIPWSRASSAYGYAQALDGTWDWYMEKTGNSGADRDEFEDAVDFIGWYANISNRTLGISKNDAFRQYLAYHEGHGGYKRGTYKKKKWLVPVARKVQRNANRYQKQLKTCRNQLESNDGFWFF